MKYIILLHILIVCAFFNFSSKMKPLINELPVTEFVSERNERSMPVIYISGDGGINTFSESLCKELVKNEFSVAALDSKKYFWTAKNPDEFTSDIEYLANYYMEQWRSNSFVLIGYSFGADVSAFVPRRISKDILDKMKALILLVPYASTDFEIKIMDMMGNNSVERKYNIPDELNAIHDHKILCLFPEDEEDTIKNSLHNKNIKIKVLPGEHRFDNDYTALVKTVFDEINE